MTGPAVSVVIPCYQQAEYLAEAVQSVFDQTYGDWEIVIVDDGSTDATAETAEALIATHSGHRIRLLRQANQGLPGARNSGIAASAGRYILPLDADDILKPDMLEKTVGLLEAEPGVAIAYTDYVRFGADSRRVETGVWDLGVLAVSCQLSGATLYRREVWEAVGGYNPNMRGGYEDWDLMMSLAERGRRGLRVPIVVYEDWDFWIGAAERGFVGRRIAESLFGYRMKSSSMVIDAIADDARLRRQIARNHPAVYTPVRRLRIEFRRQLELFPGRARYWLGWPIRRLRGGDARGVG